MQQVSVVMKGLGWGLEGKNEMFLNLMSVDPHGIMRSVWELCLLLGDENE